ncbi:hypothetical protein NHQ30_007984 [Ciborinia camelliae]|nr:hypothetical protein NHQ30_007984 [Ciborinia camelliae]
MQSNATRTSVLQKVSLKTAKATRQYGSAKDSRRLRHGVYYMQHVSVYYKYSTFGGNSHNDTPVMTFIQEVSVDKALSAYITASHSPLAWVWVSSRLLISLHHLLLPQPMSCRAPDLLTGELLVIALFLEPDAELQDSCSEQSNPCKVTEGLAIWIFTLRFFLPTPRQLGVSNTILPAAIEYHEEKALKWINELYRQLVTKAVVDAAELFLWFTFDIMDDFKFSKSFEMLESQKWHETIIKTRSSRKLLGPLAATPWLLHIGVKLLPRILWVKYWYESVEWCEAQMEERLSQGAPSGVPDLKSVFMENNRK